MDPARLEQVAALAKAAAPTEPGFDWSHYQQVFSRDEVADAEPRDLLSFVNETPGATNATTASFNRAWKTMGEREASARTRNTIRYLLYGPATVPLPDRLTRLILGQGGLGMTGFKEPALTRCSSPCRPTPTCRSPRTAARAAASGRSRSASTG